LKGTQGPAVRLLLTAGLLVLAACAVVEPPPGGPIDTQPPFVTFVYPDSGATDIGTVKTLKIAFSEKMDRLPATGWLHFFPDQRVRKTRWKGATVAEVELEQPLPADTLIVVEISGNMRDSHKVKARAGRRYPIATTDTIARGSLAGILVLEDKPLTGGVVELYGMQPDTLEYFQRPLVRRTVTDEKGAYRFDWLPIPGGPWVARAFGSKDGSLRPGERDPQRLVPDTLRITTEAPEMVVGITTLYPHDAPGRLRTGPFTAPDWPGAVLAFTMIISDADTGFVAVPTRAARYPMSVLLPDSGGVVQEVKPGNNRLIAFVDIDADSSFTSVPDTALGAAVAALTDTVTWYMEPWALLEGVAVQPGLESSFVMPVWGDSLVVAEPPPPAAVPVLPDSLGAALADSLKAALGDSLPQAPRRRSENK
jgi:hypothetical protein